MASPPDLLSRIERYYDAVPRSRTRVEEVGPFTLFVAESGWPYYARPRLGGSADFEPADVRAVLARQAELAVPQALEWMHERAPSLLDVARGAGMSVELCPLLALEGDPHGGAGSARMLHAAEPDQIALSRAAVSVGFAHPGTARGDGGIEARDAALGLDTTHTTVDELSLSLMRAGALCQAAVYATEAPELGPVGGGSYSAVDDVAEIAGVAVLPAYRRRGLGAQVTYVLASDALSRGVTTVFCSAESDDVARVYEGIGFRRVGTACIAKLAS